MAFLDQDPLQRVRNAGVVLDQQNFGGSAHAITRGKTIPKVVP